MDISVGEYGDFKNINDALESIDYLPTESEPVNIHISKGRYVEVLRIKKPYIHLLGENAESVEITFDRANGHGDTEKDFGTEETATVLVCKEATGFYCENITFTNSYNIDKKRKQVQAVAFESAADKVEMYNCRFLGRQDTLYLRGATKGQYENSANPARVAVSNCYIEGTVDFIFGDATAYFKDCVIKIYNNKGGHYTAANTTIFNIGYVFDNCRLESQSEEGKIFDLGRPWQCDEEYPYNASHTVFLNCSFPKNILKERFTKWSESTQETKIRYYVYNNTVKDENEAESRQKKRYVKELTKDVALLYNPQNIFSDWIPLHFKDEKESVKGVCDITLNKYEIDLPVNESFLLHTNLLPEGCEEEVFYRSLTPDILIVDKNGKITSVAKGEGLCRAETKNGLYADVLVHSLPERTTIPEIESSLIEYDKLGNTLKLEYKYKLDEDNKKDNALIRWYAENNGNIFVLKEGRGKHYKSYDIREEDASCTIKAAVFPATYTTYKDLGAMEAVKGDYSVPESDKKIYRIGFRSFPDKNVLYGTWKGIDHPLLKVDENKDSFFACLKESFENVSFKGRFRFNPFMNGLTEGSFDIYTNYGDEEYLRFSLKRGQNRKSLRIYIYQYISGELKLIAKDENTLKNKLQQSAGEKNPYFFITIEKKGEKATIELESDEGKSVYMRLTAKTDVARVGKVAFGSSIDKEVVLTDNISVREIKG